MNLCVMAKKSARLCPRVDIRSFRSFGIIIFDRLKEVLRPSRIRGRVDGAVVRERVSRLIGKQFSCLGGLGVKTTVPPGGAEFLRTGSGRGVLDLGPSYIKSVIFFSSFCHPLVRCRLGAFMLLPKDRSYADLA